MRPSRLIAVLLAAAGALSCGHDGNDPCALGTAGAPWLAFSSAQGGNADVYLVRADGSCRRAITSSPVFDGNPAWGPAGLVAYESDRAPGTGVWIQNVATGAERRLDLGALLAMTPAFTPDGASVVFEGRYVGSTSSSLYAVPAAGGAPTELTPEASPHLNSGPAVSPDGASVYFVSTRTGAYEIFRVPLPGGSADPEQITTGSGIVGKPTVSPDGGTLAFARSTASSTEVVLHDLATGTTTPLGIADVSEPAFDPAPASSRLALSAKHGFYPTIDLVPLSGAGATRVTTGPGPDGAPAFAPLGK